MRFSLPKIFGHIAALAVVVGGLDFQALSGAVGPKVAGGIIGLAGFVVWLAHSAFGWGGKPPIPAQPEIKPGQVGF